MLKTYSMSDVGTRMDHIMDLHELWSSAYGMMTSGGWHSLKEAEEVKKLETALEMLNYHLQNDYKDTPYAKVINALPKAEEIKNDKIDPSDFTTHRDTV